MNNDGCVAQSEEQESLKLKVVGSTPAAPTKFCGKCEQTKTTDEFHRRGKGLQPYCKTCKKENDAEYRRANMPYFVEKAKAQRVEVAKWYAALKDKPCNDCGGKFDPVCMQWDHLPQYSKSANVSNLAKTGRKSAVLAEIKKCELVCANCHALRTKNRHILG